MSSWGCHQGPLLTKLAILYGYDLGASDVGHWRRLIETLADRGLLGLLQEELWATLPESVRPEIEPLLVEDRRRRGAMALARQHQLQTLLEAFSKQGVEAACLKGAFLASCVYGDFTARPMDDIDLLIREEDFEAARATLTSIGYREEPVITGVPEYGFLSPQGLRVELICDLSQSWRFGDLVRFPMEEIWDRRRTFRGVGAHALEGWPIPSLSLDDHIIYQAFHAGFHHLFYYGYWLFDLDRMVRLLGGESDFNGFFRQARNYGCERALYVALGACRDLLETPLPRGLLGRIEPGGAWGWVLNRCLSPSAVWADLPRRRNLRFFLLQATLFDSPVAGARAVIRGFRPTRWWNGGRSRADAGSLAGWARLPVLVVRGLARFLELARLAWAHRFVGARTGSSAPH